VTVTAGVAKVFADGFVQQPRLEADASRLKPQTPAWDESEARRATTARRLLSRRNAEVFGPMRVSARVRPEQ
jgi:hypothetical protein